MKTLMTVCLTLTMAVMVYASPVNAKTAHSKSQADTTTAASTETPNTMAASSDASKPKTCKKGKVCGDTCISKSAVCKIKSADDTAQPASGNESAANTAPVETVPAANDNAGGHPNCKKGKPCGHSCIAMNKVCHKQ